MVDIKVQKGDITESEAEAIVNPANSYGLMGGGAALNIKRAGGQIIEDEAVKKAPIPVGKAISTTAGYLPSKQVIHAPTMERPAQAIDAENVKIATIAALELASELGIETLAFPGMGCGVGGVSYSDAAKNMIEAIMEYRPDYTVFLIGFDDDLTLEFQRWQKRLNHGI